MKSYKIVAFALAALALSSCAPKAHVKGTIDAPEGSRLVVSRLEVGSLSVLDTLAVKADGSFSYTLPVAKGQPEFVYLSYGPVKVASLLLEAGETAVVKADTLGHYSVEGSEGSARMQQLDERFAGIVKVFATETDPAAITKAYVDYYRASVRYIISNPFSLTSIPVLYEQINNLPVFSQATDAIHFRAVADSLAKVYPESRYVKALAKEADRRQMQLNVSTRLQNAGSVGYPDLNMPDVKGVKTALSSLDAKVVLIHFWDASDPAQKMMNIETILPVYNEYHSRGFEVYSVCLSTDKKQWADAVSAQNLPWVNVNDGLGANSPSVVLYNVSGLPLAYVIASGEIVSEPVKDAAGLRKLLARLL